MNKDKKLLIRVIILIILLLLIFITSFRAGSKLYTVEESVRSMLQVKASTKKARWNFNARIIVRNEVFYGEIY